MKTQNRRNRPRWQNLYGWGGALVLVVLALLIKRQLTASEPEATLQPALPQDPLIQAYFNYSPSHQYREPYRDQIRLGDNLEQVIIEAIQSAQSSVDVAVQELNLPGIAHALVAKHQDGVPVRVIMENQYRQSWSDRDRDDLEERDRHKYSEFLRLVDRNQDGQIQSQEALQRDAISILDFAGIPIIDDTADGTSGSGLMHHKFVVIDGHTVLTGSANFTLSGIHGDFSQPESRGNANHVLRLQHPELATLMTEEFNLMWGDGPGGQLDSVFGLQKPLRMPRTLLFSPQSTVTIQFSPVSSDRYSWEHSGNGLINTMLEQAQTTIDLALFVFSDQRLSHTLQTKQHLPLRVLIDPGFIYRPYSEALDMLGTALPNTSCQYDAENRPWSHPISTVGTPQLAPGDKLHHKFAVIDHTAIVTGSQNWSDSANHRNDELVLAIENPTVAAHFQREFDRLYQYASLGLSQRLQTKIAAQVSQCAAGSIHRSVTNLVNLS